MFDFADLEEQLSSETETAVPERQTRVLCLHGAGSNAQVMEFQTGALRNALRLDFDFEFLEASCEVYSPTQDPSVAVIAGGAKVKSWFNEDSQGLSNIEDVLASVDEHIERHGPYDVLMGFSQGCDVITMLSSHYEQTYKAPKLNVLWCPDHDLAFKSNDRYKKRCDHMAVHAVLVLGLEDGHYEAGAASAACWYKPRVLEHRGGHRVPQERRDIIAAVADEMRRCCAMRH